MDYLIDEALTRQPEAVQDFLLKTSILERFNADLCAEVCAESPFQEATAAGCRAMLDTLEHANLFLVPLDNQREWYRYHHLFADLLRYRLKVQTGETFTAGLKQRASHWFETHDLADEAIHYAQAARDWGLSSRLIIEQSTFLIQNSEALILLRWLRGMPEAVLEQNADLCMIYAYALTASGRLDLGRSYFLLAKKGLADQPDRLGCALAFKIF